jgi:hypothetical protein
MLVQVVSAKHDQVWYKKKIFEIYEVEDRDDDTLYFLTRKQLKKIKKAPHLDIGIMKEDCIPVNSRDKEGSDCIYNVENFLKLFVDEV